MRWFGIALVVATSAAGCSLLAPSDDELLGGGTGGTTITAGAAGSTATGGGGAGGAAGAVTGGSGGTVTGGSGGAPSSGGAAGSGVGGVTCVAGTEPASARQVMLFILLDRTGSMAQNNKWSYATKAIHDFDANPAAAGVEVGLQYFDLPGGQCDGTGYATPAVPFAALPGNDAALVASMNQTAPTGVTNLEGPLNGVKKVSQAILAQQPNRQIVTAFVTDVDFPFNGGGCSDQVATQTAILASIWPSAATYFIALQAADTALVNALAQAGGTAAALQAAGSAAAITTALLRTITACRYKIPPSTVAFTLKEPSGDDYPLTKVGDATSCNDLGWFTLPSAPSTAVLCPTACKQLADAGGSIEVTVTCP